jgi:hypothetical protein
LDRQFLQVGGGDVDGDGTNDVAFSHSERAGYAVTWYRRANGAWSAHPVAIVDYAHTLQVYDADLDGDRDVLTGGMPQSTHRGLRLFLNAGAGASWTPQIIQSEGSYSAELGDVDNDAIRMWGRENKHPPSYFPQQRRRPPSPFLASTRGPFDYRTSDGVRRIDSTATKTGHGRYRYRIPRHLTGQSNSEAVTTTFSKPRVMGTTARIACMPPIRTTIDFMYKRDAPARLLAS